MRIFNNSIQIPYILKNFQERKYSGIYGNRCILNKVYLLRIIKEIFNKVKKKN